MILELTPDQKAYQQTIAAFAATRVAPMAATIDDEGTFPGALIKEAARDQGLGKGFPRIDEYYRRLWDPNRCCSFGRPK